MHKTLLILGLLLSTSVIAQNFPDYYPEEGFNRTAIVNSVDTETSQIVIGDLVYRMNSRPIVRSLSSRYDSLARIRPGVRVAFRLDENREIVEFWLLPKNYTRGRSR